ncbi:copper homeostasis protein cutC homolog [Stomoxys calcitrans]|uniref:Copper homeostasis protein cutC homolog n=1 Tax=Stomoxys calcitrans TaxID=35570 RepID=A0A1I8NNL6_STOCA|nr:copper homeostasis protein cutC homolog [Stomoxys calcitrans]
MSAHHNIKLEVCVDSIASAIAAMEGGAARIELCSALNEGGLTPSVGILKILKSLPLNIPIYCMLRPRRGNDFIYTDLEMKALLHDMELLQENGADGFVFGSLTPSREINVEQCQQVLEKAKSLPMTFHRAFDLTDPLKMYENAKILIELGFQRILCSGFRQTATEGIDSLAQLIAKHHREIIIMPGAGINVTNLEEILTATKCCEFHGSAKSPPTSEMPDSTESNSTKMECDVSMGKQDILPYDICDVNVVRKMVAIASAMAEK